MSEAGKYALAAVLVVGFLAWFGISQSRPRKPPSSLPTAHPPASETKQNLPHPPAKPTACEIEHRAAKRHLPAVGDTLLGPAAVEDFLPFSKRGVLVPPKTGRIVATVTDVRTQCFSDGFGVLILLADKKFRETQGWQANASQVLVGNWVRTLVAENHNPRTLNRTLFVKAILNHARSVTGVQHFTLMHEARYSPTEDEVNSITLTERPGMSGRRVDWGSKAAPDDFW